MRERKRFLLVGRSQRRSPRKLRGLLPGLLLLTAVLLAAAILVLPRSCFIFGSHLGQSLRTMPACTTVMAASAAAKRIAPGAENTIKVKCKEDGQWYDAVVTQENSDGTLSVCFDKAGYTYSYLRVENCLASHVDNDRGFFKHTEFQKLLFEKPGLAVLENISDRVWLDGVVESIEPYGAFLIVQPAFGGELCKGLLRKSQINDGHVKEITDELTIGQHIKVRIVALDIKAERLSLSMRPPRCQTLLEFNNISEGAWLEGVVDRIESFGAFVLARLPYGGEACRGLVHLSQLTWRHVENVEDEVKVGQRVRVRVVRVDLEHERLDLSMRPLRSEALLAFRSVSNDAWLEGVVDRIEPFGAFVLTRPPCGSEPCKGMVHISQRRNEYVQNMEDDMKVGQQVKVRITTLDLEKERLDLTMRPLQSEALLAFKSIAAHAWLEGVVISTEPYGAFVETKPPCGGTPYKGLLHVSQMKPGHVETGDVEMQVGQHVMVRVLAADLDRGRLDLSMRQPPGEILLGFKNISEDAWLEGVVDTIESFGVFVWAVLPSGNGSYKGLVHTSEIKRWHLEKIEDELRVGQKVKVRMLECDLEHGRLELSMCPPQSQQALFAFQNLSKDVWLQGVVSKVQSYGALVWAKPLAGEEPYRGLVPVSQIKSWHVEKVEDELSVGQPVKVRVHAVDIEQGRLEFSLRPLRNESSALAFLNVSEGMWLEGIVSHIESFGAFVWVKSPCGGETCRGLVHVSQMKHGFNSNVSDEVAVGQQVRVRVMKSNLTATPHQLSMLPYEPVELLEKVPQHIWLDGRVNDTDEVSALIEVQAPSGGATCMGTVSIYDMKHGHVDRVDSILTAGQPVKVRVKSVNMERRKVFLSLRSHQNISGFQNVFADKWFTGVVESFEPRGIMVLLTPPSGGNACRGLVHVSEVPQDVESTLEIGKNVSVRVCRAVQSSEDLDLSMKAAQDITQFEGMGNRIWLSAVVTQVYEPRGALAVLQPPGGGRACTGWLTASQMKDDTAQNMADALSVGQMISVRVLSADHGKLRLSMLSPTERTPRKLRE